MQAGRSGTLPARQAVCWCGQRDLQPFSPEYVACAACGTLVSRVGLTAEEIVVHDDPEAFYGKDYWLAHQVEDLGNPDIHHRARADLPERCMHWLRTLVGYKPPPARVLEIGCAHGGFVALLRSLGYDASGLELSPWVVEFARRTFDVPMLQGLIEEQQLPEGSFDAIVLNDVVEHLVDPLATLGCCARLLHSEGVLVVQMPSYPEGVAYEQLRTRQDRFLEHIDGKARQHLHLFSPRAAQRLFARLGFPALDFVPPMYDYDMYLVTSRQALRRYPLEELATLLQATPAGRVRLAWLELAFQSAARDETLRVCEADRAARLDVIQRLDAALRASEADRAARLDVIERLAASLRKYEAHHPEIRRLDADRPRCPRLSLPQVVCQFSGRLLRSMKRLLRAG